MDNNLHSKLGSTPAQAISKAPTSVIVARAMFFLNAAIWILFSILTLRRTHGSTAWIVAILMAGNAGAMLLAGWGIGKRQKWFYYLGIAVLAVNIVLTVTDEFGLFDLITLLIDVILLVLLLATRSRYSSGSRIRRTDGRAQDRKGD
jgi:uncharacterized membrane protein (DUF2068 family)